MKRACLGNLCLLALFLSAVSVFLPGNAAAQGEGRAFKTARALVEAVSSRAASVHSLVCDIRQEKHLAMLAHPVVFTGRMMVQRPDRLRWEFARPISSAFIINGSRVIRCSPGMPPMEFDTDTNPVMKQAAAQMLAWVSGDFKGLASMFSMALSDQGTGLVLVPHKHAESAGITKITVMFDPSSLRPTSVRLDEQGGDWTEISMSNYRINTAIPDRLFSRCEKQ